MEFNSLATDKNWQKYSLEEICLKITSGGTPSRQNPKLYKNGNINWIKTKELNNGYIFESEEKITEEAIKRSSAKLLPVNTILLAMYGATVGELGILGKEMACNQACCALIIDPKKADYRFIFYLLRLYKKEIQSLATGAAQQNLSAKTIKEFSFYIPNLEKQKKIADILSELDKKIDLNTQINQTLEQIAQALFKSWFVNFDPVRAKVQAFSDGLSLEQAELAAMQTISGKTPEELTALSQTQPDRYAELAETAKAFPCEMVEVDGIEVPKGWLVSTISECSLKIQNGGTPKRSNLEFWENGEIPWLSSGEVCNNKVLVQSKEYITDLGLKGSAAKLIPPYSTLVAIYASPTAGKCAFSGFETSTNQAVCAIIPKEEYTFFNYYHLQLQEKYFVNQASGSAQQNISKKIIEETPVLIPNKIILKKFNLLAKPIIKKTIENLKENNNLERKRDLLLPKLLNGEVS